MLYEVKVVVEVDEHNDLFDGEEQRCRVLTAAMDKLSDDDATVTEMKPKNAKREQ